MVFCKSPSGCRCWSLNVKRSCCCWLILGFLAAMQLCRIWNLLCSIYPSNQWLWCGRLGQRATKITWFEMSQQPTKSEQNKTNTSHTHTQDLGCLILSIFLLRLWFFQTPPKKVHGTGTGTINRFPNKTVQDAKGVKIIGADQFLPDAVHRPWKESFCWLREYFPTESPKKMTLLFQAKLWTRHFLFQTKIPVVRLLYRTPSLDTNLNPEARWSPSTQRRQMLPAAWWFLLWILYTVTYIYIYIIHKYVHVHVCNYSNNTYSIWIRRHHTYRIYLYTHTHTLFSHLPAAGWRQGWGFIDCCGVDVAWIRSNKRLRHNIRFRSVQKVFLDSISIIRNIINGHLVNINRWSGSCSSKVWALMILLREDIFLKEWRHFCFFWGESWPGSFGWC